MSRYKYKYKYKYRYAHSVETLYTRTIFLGIYGADYAVREYKSYRLEGFMAIRHEDKL